MSEERPEAPGAPGTEGTEPGPRRRREKSHILRPPGLVVFLVFLLLVGALWWLFADTVVERSVEATGTSVVGARVDLASADLRPSEGSLRLTGLQVTNPAAPMTNLFEAEEILVDLLLEPLLTKKFVVQEARVTGVRFNTPRETSGALEDADPASAPLWREVEAWAEQVDLPPLSLEGLSTVVRTDAISTDSLRTVQQARALADRADSLRTDWQQRIESLDPRPRIDSVEAVAQRLQEFRLTPLTATQVPGLVREGRSALERLTSLEDELQALDQAVRAGVDSLQTGVGRFPELRQQDLAYARGLLNIPSLEAPEISPAIFGDNALDWLAPVLYWARVAERYMPPGLDPRRRPGPERVRAEGTTVEFPGRATYPDFLLQEGVLGFLIAGEGLAAGDYSATVRNLTTSPELLGRPLELVAGRAAGAQGVEGLSLAAVLDHTGEVIRDSVSLSLAGIDLPAVDLGDFGGRLALGRGDASFGFRRVGDEIDARLHWSTNDLEWLTGDTDRAAAGAGADPAEPDAAPDPAPASGIEALTTGASGLQIGSEAWVRDLLRRTISGLERVELTMGLSGTIESPDLSVSSNIGSAVAQSLRDELGQEIQAAEARLRQEVESRVQPVVQEARGRVTAVEEQIAQRVDAELAEVQALRARLEDRIESLVPGG